MVIMESSKLNKDHVYDRIRGSWFCANDEELVRQSFLRLMIDELGYPRELLVVEKKLNQLPHLADQARSLPSRRIDILCYFRAQSEDLSPLLLIECKEGKINTDAIHQLCGYNHYIKAPFIATVGREKVYFGYQKNHNWRFSCKIPSYAELIADLRGDK